SRAFSVPRRHRKAAERRRRKATGLRRPPSIWQPGCRSPRPRSVSPPITSCHGASHREARAVLFHPPRFPIALPSFTGLAAVAVALFVGAALVMSTAPVAAAGNSTTFKATDDTTVEES